MRSNQLSYAPRPDRSKFTTRLSGGQVAAASRLCRALALFAALVLLLSACQLREVVESLPSSSPTATTPAADGWEELSPGLELQRALATGTLFGQLTALRVDPQRYHFRAHYQPGEALTLEGWRAALPDAVAFINANFFDSELQVNGLLVADGVAHGQPWLTRGGTLLLREGRPQLRPNQERPWLTGQLQQAVQGFPMLVHNGARVYRRNGPPARRSAVALDRSGRVLLLATPLPGLSLAALAEWLAASELEIVSALNLDGGGSTLLHVRGAETANIASLDAVPALLAVWPA